MSFLLDTDVCSAHLRGDRKVFSKFLQFAGQLHVSVITAGELYSWVLRSKSSADRLQLLQRFLMGVRLLPVDHEVAYRFGIVRAELLDRGKAPASTDLFLAATALVHNLTMVTHNVRHFSEVPQLAVKDWLAG